MKNELSSRMIFFMYFVNVLGWIAALQLFYLGWLLFSFVLFEGPSWQITIPWSSPEAMKLLAFGFIYWLIGLIHLGGAYWGRRQLRKIVRKKAEVKES